MCLCIGLGTAAAILCFVEPVQQQHTIPAFIIWGRMQNYRENSAFAMPYIFFSLSKAKYLETCNTNNKLDFADVCTITI